MPVNSQNKEKFYNYDAFVEKFKAKKTTDDCYTPPKVYETIKNFVIKEYGIDEKKIVRPFFPGGDFEKFDYTGGKVVVDNPPFSILRKIKDFYCKNNIKFFLFAPHLTLFSSNDDKSVCYILANAIITYENGARVNTSFITNMDKYRIRTKPKLQKELEEVQENKKTLPRYQYPKNVISPALLNKIVKDGLELDFKDTEVYFIRELDSQKKYKKTIFGAGFLISDEKAKIIEREEKENAKEKLEKEDFNTVEVDET